MYHIWNLEREMWWKGNKFGYTNNIEEAGLFTLEEAEKISKEANIMGYINDKMVNSEDNLSIKEVQMLSGKVKKPAIEDILAMYNKNYHKTNPMGHLIQDLKDVEYYPEEISINHLDYEKSERYNLKIENESNLNVVINLYRMPSGNYEVNSYTASNKPKRKLKF